MKMKGQIYILIAVIIVVSISALANIGFYSSMPVQREQTSLSSSNAVVNNITSEIAYVMKHNDSNLDDFILIAEQYAKEKNLNLTVNKSEH